MKEILFVYQEKRSFIQKDLEILSGISKVQAYKNFPPSWRNIMPILKEVRRAEIVFIWFLGRHAILPLLLAKFLRKKIVLIAGGWDVASCPEISYGSMRPGIRAALYRLLFKLPTMILSVSKSNHEELLKHARVHAEKTCMIYHGFNHLATPREGFRKEGLVITIGDVCQSNLKRKGLTQFVRVAAYFPNIPFLLVGRWEQDGAIDFLRIIAPSNVRLIGFAPDKELNQYLDKAAVYVQLSYHEAFGCSVAEAMLHECVPVVANIFALPEVVGEAGYIVPLEEEPAAVDAIRKALVDKEKGPQARQRILTHFPLESRRRELSSIIQSLL